MSLYGWITSSEFAALAGVLGVVVGVAVNWFYKAKADRRQQAEHELRVARLRRGESSDTDAGDLS